MEGVKIVKVVENVETVKSVQSVKSVESVKNVKIVEVVESVETVKTVKAVESLEHAKSLPTSLYEREEKRSFRFRRRQARVEPICKRGKKRNPSGPCLLGKVYG